MIIGELTNVPQPGAPVQSPWAQAVSARVVHRFASKSALDAGWSAPAVGSYAQTMDDGMLYRRLAGGWSHQLPISYQTTGLDSASFPVGFTGMTCRLTIPADAGPRFLMVNWHCYSIKNVAGPADFAIRLNGTGFTAHRPINSSVGAAVNFDLGHLAVNLVAGAAGVVECWAASGWQTFADPNFNLLSVVACPGASITQITPTPP